jgi:hypothetical protein
MHKTLNKRLIKVAWQTPIESIYLPSTGNLHVCAGRIENSFITSGRSGLVIHEESASILTENAPGLSSPSANLGHSKRESESFQKRGATSEPKRELLVRTP